ncbi:hypothetical protein C8A00DRAFT_31403 [Chaetomidium leptoderma]|uniref:Uncharacterized protein n=1 Tax=Chaetomidium leptoderma TaxID=669021 RepID=A0AAN6VQ56_9PEZI|nr:hypothetical protein C8A00DRAFT_31403 [Chaetomidium leptoderma]
MLRTTRLPPGRRALLPHIPARPVTFATGKGNTTRPISIFAGTGREGSLRPNPSTSSSRWFFTRPPSTWSPSTIVTVGGGIMLAGLWYIWEEGRTYIVADEADRYEPRVLGTHREGKVNPDYVSYEQWVERHGRKGR